MKENGRVMTNKLDLLHLQLHARTHTGGTNALMDWRKGSKECLSVCARTELNLIESQIVFKYCNVLCMTLFCRDIYTHTHTHTHIFITAQQFEN